MATIRKISDLSYEIECYAGSDSQGKPIRHRCTYRPKETAPTKQRKEVEKYALEFEERIRQGKYLEGDKLTFSEFSEHWKKLYAKDNISVTLREHYDRMLEKRILPKIGHMRLVEIKPLHLMSLYSDLEAEGLKPATIKSYHALIRSIFRSAFHWEIVRANPCDRCSLPRQKEKYNYQIWTPDQVQRFLSALEETYTAYYRERVYQKQNGELRITAPYQTELHVASMFKALYYLAVYTGARRGELCALTWEDIDFKTKEVRISKAVAKTKEGQVAKEPKTKSSVRRISVPDICIRMLQSWRKDQIQLAFNIGSLWKGYTGKDFSKNPIFIQQDSGLMINIDTISHKFGEIVDNYNKKCENDNQKLPVIRFHDLRHTSASLMIANHVDVVTVSHRLGHSKPSTTMDIYSHALPLQDKIAADILSDVIGEN